MTTSPGRPLVFRMQDKVGSGAYANVFRHPSDGRAYKLFKAYFGRDHLKIPHDQTLMNMRERFDGEVEAYRIAMAVEAIRPLVPAFHGTIAVDQVLDDDGEEISGRYQLGHCYALDYVGGGPEDKLRNVIEVSQPPPHLVALKGAFESNGIGDWRDASVFHADDPALTKVIDFAVKSSGLRGHSGGRGPEGSR